MPSLSSTSALPHRLEAALFPCFATMTPQAAMTKATVVEILKVFVPLPPVPQVSMIVSASIFMSSVSMSRAVPMRIFIDFSLITFAAPVISSTVSPFILSAVTNAPICEYVAFPLMMSLNTVRISRVVKSRPLTTFSIIFFIIF